jgi:hypothetical protein
MSRPFSSHHDRCLGHRPPDPIGEGADRPHAVVDEVDLAATLHLVQDRLANHLLGELDDTCFNRLPITRRCFDDRDVTETAERKVEGSGDRRRRHRDDVDFGAQLLEALLLGYAEALFLIEHDQPEIAKIDRVSKKPVRSHNNVHPSFGEAVNDLRSVGLRNKSGQHSGFHWKSLEAATEGLQMLIDEDRGRCEHRHLLALEYRFEGCSDGDFGLPVADITTQQPIHRSRRLHVLFDLTHGPVLIRGQFELERVLELALPGGIGRKRETAGGLPRRRQAQQLRRHFPHSLFDSRFAPPPAASAQTIELGFDIGLARGVLLDQIRTLDGDQERVASVIGQNEHLQLPTLHRHASKARELPDTVIEMNDQVTRPEVPEIRHKGADTGASSARPRGRGEIAASIHRENALPDESVLQFALDNRYPARWRWRRNRFHLALTQEVGESPSFSRRGHN